MVLLTTWKVITNQVTQEQEENLFFFLVFFSQEMQLCIPSIPPSSLGLLGMVWAPSMASLAISLKLSSVTPSTYCFSSLHVLSQFLQSTRTMGDIKKHQFFPQYLSLQAAVCEIPTTTGRPQITVVIRAGNSSYPYCILSSEKLPNYN